MEIIDNNNEYKIQLYTTSLMLMIASADNDIGDEELEIIKKNLINFFHIGEDLSEELIKSSYNIIGEATDIYELGSFINKSLNSQEKIELLSYIFKVAYSDKNFHFMERHLINQIANILNINKDKVLKAKKEVLSNLL